LPAPLQPARRVGWRMAPYSALHPPLRGRRSGAIATPLEGLRAPAAPAGGFGSSSSTTGYGAASPIWSDLAGSHASKAPSMPIGAD